MLYRFDAACDAPLGDFAAAVTDWPELSSQFGGDGQNGSAEPPGEDGQLEEIEYQKPEYDEKEDW